MKSSFAAMTAFLTLVCAADQVSAQGSSRTSNSAARTSASSPSMFGGTTGSRTAGGRGAGGQGGASAAMGQNGEFQLGGGATTTGSERYMRGNRQSGNFVGADAAEVSQFFSTLTGGGGGTDGFSAFGPQSNRGRGNNVNNQADSNSRSTTVPHRLVVAFRHAPPRIQMPTPNSSGEITLRGLSRLQSRGPLSVQLRDRTAILRGVVATDHDRALAEQLTLLEPGISQVQNELTVAETLPTVSPQLAPE